jgi:hypothetical protein
LSDDEKNKGDGKKGAATSLPRRTILGIPGHALPSPTQASPQPTKAAPDAVPAKPESIEAEAEPTTGSGKYRPKSPGAAAQKSLSALRRDPTLVGLPQEEATGTGSPRHTPAEPKPVTAAHVAHGWLEAGKKPTDASISLPRRRDETESLESQMPIVAPPKKTGPIKPLMATQLAPAGPPPLTKEPALPVSPAARTTEHSEPEMALGSDDLVDLSEGSAEEDATVAAGMSYANEVKQRAEAVRSSPPPVTNIAGDGEGTAPAWEDDSPRPNTVEIVLPTELRAPRGQAPMAAAVASAAGATDMAGPVPEPPFDAVTVVDPHGPDIHEQPTTEAPVPHLGRTASLDTGSLEVNTPLVEVPRAVAMTTAKRGVAPVRSPAIGEEAEGETPPWYARPSALAAVLGVTILLVLGGAFALRAWRKSGETAPELERTQAPGRGAGQRTFGESAEEPPSTGAIDTSAAVAPTVAPLPPATTPTPLPTARPSETAATGEPPVAAPVDSAAATTLPAIELPKAPASVRKLSGAQRRAKARPLRNKAEKALKKRDAKGLLGLATRWLELDPGSASAANAMARAMLLSKRAPEAVAWADRAVGFSGKTAEFHATRGEALAVLGDKGAAKVACQRAAKLAKSPRETKACFAAIE